MKIKRGLNIPIEGKPAQVVNRAPLVRRVALVGGDYMGMRPTMAVKEGDSVKLGQLLFSDKKTPGVCYTSPGCGKVVAINRAAKRKFESTIIELDGDDQVVFQSYADEDLSELARDQVRDNLLSSGLWTAFRTRPYSKVPPHNSVPSSIFVTAIDTNPLAAQADLIIAEQQTAFVDGVHAISCLTDGKIYVCAGQGTEVPGDGLSFVHLEKFAGPHPAGLPGTHIHLLEPVNNKKMVWHVGYQDVIAIGKLFRTGRLFVDRIVSLAGPSVKEPCLIRSRVGASIDDMVRGKLADGDQRVISGSILSGRHSVGSLAFLGRYHLQVCALPEGHKRELLGWQRPGFDKFSVKRAFASAFLGANRIIPFSTSTGGSDRSMVPIGMYEQVMPLDMIPTFLLRALIVGDVEQAQLLGCLELDEDDLALCTFVCPGKYDFGPLLRTCLTKIEKEG